NEGIAQEMRRDSSVFLLGEDVRHLGGVWGHTTGLYEEFGAERVLDTPISETGFIGAASGAAALGMRPIVELMFVDFLGVCFNAIYNLAAKTCYFSAGGTPVPMVINTAVGGGYSDGGQHSQVLWATFAHMPGLKVVVPSNSYDAKGLMIAAIRDNNPVIYMFHKQLQGMGFLGTVAGAVAEVPKEPYVVPLGVANVVEEGTDLTIVGLGATVHIATAAAAELRERAGVSVEVIDVRSVVPLDRAAIVRSVKKTGRLIVVDDDYLNCGLTAEIIASVTESDVRVFKSSPIRIAYPDVPPPFSPPLEQFCLPSVARVVDAAHRCLGESADRWPR
ncbi:MAG: transketolase C-terminal domain-containing protein, partial [Gammaproteobacteria bacterium]